jgi:molecular chaperone GrpE
MSDETQTPMSEEEPVAARPPVAEAPETSAEDKKAAKPERKKAGKRGKKPAKPKPEDVLKGQVLRLQADFDNFRKRTLREKNDLYKRANENIMDELLPVLDHMDMALKAAADHDATEAFTEGFRLVADQMLTVLKKFGLNPIEADGATFDPNVHEAISHLPSTDVPEGGIMAEARRGFTLGDYLLRPAQVVVSRGDPNAPPVATEPDAETTTD